MIESPVTIAELMAPIGSRMSEVEKLACCLTSENAPLWTQEEDALYLKRVGYLMDWTLNALDAHAAILPKFEDRHPWLWDSYRMIIEKLSDLPAFDTLSLPLIEGNNVHAARRNDISGLLAGLRCVIQCNYMEYRSLHPHELILLDLTKRVIEAYGSEEDDLTACTQASAEGLPEDIENASDCETASSCDDEPDAADEAPKDEDDEGNDNNVKDEAFEEENTESREQSPHSTDLEEGEVKEEKCLHEDKPVIELSFRDAVIEEGRFTPSLLASPLPREDNDAVHAVPSDAKSESDTTEVVHDADPDSESETDSIEEDTQGRVEEDFREEQGLLLRRLQHYEPQAVEPAALGATFVRPLIAKVIGGHPTVTFTHFSNKSPLKLGAKYGHSHVLYPRSIKHLSLPKVPGESGCINWGFNDNDWANFTDESIEVLLFCNVETVSRGTSYMFLGSYECTRVQSLSTTAWNALDTKVQDHYVKMAYEKAETFDKEKKMKVNKYQDKNDVRARFNAGTLQVPRVELKFSKYDHEFAAALVEEYKKVEELERANPGASKKKKGSKDKEKNKAAEREQSSQPPPTIDVPTPPILEPVQEDQKVLKEQSPDFMDLMYPPSDPAWSPSNELDSPKPADKPPPTPPRAHTPAVGAVPTSVTRTFAAPIEYRPSTPVLVTMGPGGSGKTSGKKRPFDTMDDGGEKRPQRAETSKSLYATTDPRKRHKPSNHSNF